MQCAMELDNAAVTNPRVVVLNELLDLIGSLATEAAPLVPK